MNSNHSGNKCSYCDPLFHFPMKISIGLALAGEQEEEKECRRRRLLWGWTDNNGQFSVYLFFCVRLWRNCMAMFFFLICVASNGFWNSNGTHFTMDQSLFFCCFASSNLSKMEWKQGIKKRQWNGFRRSDKHIVRRVTRYDCVLSHNNRKTKVTP